MDGFSEKRYKRVFHKRGYGTTVHVPPFTAYTALDTMTTDGNYVEQYLPPHLVEKLEAGAFRSLCAHLKERSDEVQNIDLMTIAGFCRNCLAKVSL